MSWDNMNIWDEMCKMIAENANRQAYMEALEQEKIQSAVLVCNRENKYKLLSVIPTLCILGTDLCDDKIYMITDKEMADNARKIIKG